MITISDVWYFITYIEDNGKRELIDAEITNTYPVRWLYDYRKNYPNVRVNILFWSEIPEVFAEAFREEFQ